MVSHHCAKFVGHSHSTSGDIIFLLVEEQDCTWSHLNLPLLFIPKVYGNLCSHQQNSIIKRTLKKTFANERVSNEISSILVTHHLLG